MFADDYAQATASNLSKPGVMRFDSNFLAAGFGIEHDAFVAALNAHLADLNEYGQIEASDGQAMLNAVQAMGVMGYAGGASTLIASSFATHIVYSTLATLYAGECPNEASNREIIGIRDTARMYAETLIVGHAVNVKESWM